MEEIDIPIFRKIYDLYKVFYSYRDSVAKRDRYTIYQRAESILLDLVQCILSASQLSKSQKLPALEDASLKLNFLRVFIRMMKDVKAIDNKKYLVLQEYIDEIGRMLGGWIRSTKAI